MENLAYALLNAAAFLELSSEDVLELEASVKALEQIAVDLQSINAQERGALASAAAALATESREAGAGFSDRAAFFESFFESFGLNAGEEG